VIAHVNAMAGASPKKLATIEPIIDETDDLPRRSHNFFSLALVSGHEDLLHDMLSTIKWKLFLALQLPYPSAYTSHEH
jgi:hypothetical protein